jgi:hypothetical protein
MKPTHTLERTSPKGGPFIGTCTRCGRQNLRMGDALEECSNDRNISDDDALIDLTRCGVVSRRTKLPPPSGG